MRVRISEIRKIVREEMDRVQKAEKLQEVTPFGAVTSIGGQRAPRGRKSSRYSDSSQSPAPKESDPTSDAWFQKGELLAAAPALKKVSDALKSFNPAWHKFMCQSSQGQEMSDLVIDLEKTVNQAAKVLGESKKIGISEIRQMISKEVESMALQELFGQVSKAFSGPRQSSRGSDRFDYAPSGQTVAQVQQDTTPSGPVFPHLQKLVSDWLFLYNSFTPKLRRWWCLGKEGDKLAQALEELDSVLAKSL